MNQLCNKGINMISVSSIANCDLLDLGKQIYELIAGNIKFLHIDLRMVAMNIGGIS